MTSARILIVDDEPAMLRSVERILSGEHEVRSSASPKEALEIAREFKPHLAVVDIRMEGMDGFQLMNNCDIIQLSVGSMDRNLHIDVVGPAGK